MGEQSIVCDTSLLLYLGRLKKGKLLPDLYKRVCVPEKVVLELDAGRLLRSDTIDPRQIDRVKVVSVSQKQIDDLPPNKLGIGEQSVIAYATNQTNFVAGLDDRVARLFADQLGLEVIGMIGVLLNVHLKSNNFSDARIFTELQFEVPQLRDIKGYMAAKRFSIRNALMQRIDPSGS